MRKLDLKQSNFGLDKQWTNPISTAKNAVTIAKVKQKYDRAFGKELFVMQRARLPQITNRYDEIFSTSARISRLLSYHIYCFKL
jgi:hypothetical protein